VNLPVRHIIVENPRRGPKTMSRADFLNLAGRAGRLLKEFHGNIWCLRPGEWNPVEGGELACFEGERLQELSSAFEAVLQDGGSIVQRAVSSADLSRTERELAAASLGKV